MSEKMMELVDLVSDAYPKMPEFVQGYLIGAAEAINRKENSDVGSKATDESSVPCC